MNSSSAKLILKVSSKTYIWYGALAFMLLFAGGGLATSQLKISGAVIATGTVSVLGKPKIIQHLDGGIVVKISVKDGEYVNAGAKLIELDTTLLVANVSIYSNRLREALATRARLLAERDDRAKILWDDKPLKLLGIMADSGIKAGQFKLFKAREETRTSQIRQREEKIKQFRNQIDGIQALQASKIRQIGHVERELIGLQDLLQRQYTTLTRVMALLKEKDRLNGEKAEQDAEIARVRNLITEVKIQALQIKQEFRESVIQELREVEQTINDMTQQLYATKEQLARATLRAPVSGLVHDMNIFTIRGVIRAGDPVMTIIPQEVKMVVEARILPQNIDDVYIDQTAKVRFSSFSQRNTPELKGKVSSISASSLVDSTSGGSYYLVELAVFDDELSKLNGKKLISGMPAEIHLRTEDRTILNYLTKPLMDQINRAFREE